MCTVAVDGTGAQGEIVVASSHSLATGELSIHPDSDTQTGRSRVDHTAGSTTTIALLTLLIAVSVAMTSMWLALVMVYLHRRWCKPEHLIDGQRHVCHV